MFKKNTAHLEPDLFGFFSQLSENMQKKLRDSEEYLFYQLIYRRIPEEEFACLYSENGSRPNAPVNAMVSALYLQQRYKWTFEELFKQIEFNLLTKAALGLSRLDEIPFCPASLFNFLCRLSQHSARTGENLLEKVFNHLTKEQLKALKIKTNIQRTDSFLAASNIRNYTRLQLLIELLLRIWRILTEEDKARFRDHFSAYLSQSSGQYIYQLDASSLPHELKKMARLYEWVNGVLRAGYGERDIFQTFDRVFAEQFTRVKKKLRLKSNEEISSNSVQSPDDLDATYRKKNHTESRGQSIHVVETAHPENGINLIDDVSVHPNNRDDSQILAERLEPINEKTPDLEELHFDGGYGSEAVDKKLAELEITGIQTAVRGRESEVPITIEKESDSHYQVSCPQQTVHSSLARKRHKAQFNLAVCQTCKLARKCPAKAGSRYRTFYFTEKEYLSKRRQKSIYSIPENRRRLRPNIEATIKEFTHRMPQKKLKVRGFFRTSVFAFSSAVAINFGRIYRYLRENPEIAISLALKSYVYVKDQIRCFFCFVQNVLKADILKKLFIVPVPVFYHATPINLKNHFFTHFLERTHSLFLTTNQTFFYLKIITHKT